MLMLINKIYFFEIFIGKLKLNNYLKKIKWVSILNSDICQIPTIYYF